MTTFPKRHFQSCVSLRSGGNRVGAKNSLHLLPNSPDSKYPLKRPPFSIFQPIIMNCSLPKSPGLLLCLALRWMNGERAEQRVKAKEGGMLVGMQYVSAQNSPLLFYYNSQDYLNTKIKSLFPLLGDYCIILVVKLSKCTQLASF